MTALTLTSDAPDTADAVDFAAWWQEHRTYIFRFLARRAGGDTQLAEDLTADTFLRAMTSTYRDQGKPRAWLTTIARNLLADHYKAHARRTVTVDDLAPTHVPMWTGEPVWPDAVAEVASVRAVLEVALAELTDAQAQVIRLRYFEGLSVAETVDAIGGTEGQVKALTYRAVRALAGDARIHDLIGRTT